MFRVTSALFSGLQMLSKKAPVNKLNARARGARLQEVHNILRKYNVNPGKYNKLPKPRDWTEEDLPKMTWAKEDKQLYIEKVSNKDGKFRRWRHHRKEGK